jgi:hypothetical protein
MSKRSAEEAGIVASRGSTGAADLQAADALAAQLEADKQALLAGA